MPKLSIIVPVYNMERYIEECIKSIQNQNYKDYEVILIDDGSSDGSYECASKIVNIDKRFRIIRKNNGGVSAARNVGLDQANGEWIMFVDPDDTLCPTLISTLFSLTNEEIDIVSCCCNVFGCGKNEVDQFFSADRDFSTFEEKRDLYKQLMDSHYCQPGAVYTAIGVPWGKIYRKKFLNENNLRFNLRLKRYQDNIFNMYAFVYARTVRYFNQPLYNYRLEHIKKYGKEYKPEYAEYMRALCEERFSGMNELGLFNDEELKEFYRNEVLKHLWSIMKDGIFAQENPMTYRQRREQAKRLCQDSCFSLLFEGSSKNFGVKDKVKYCLLKYKQFKTIEIIFSVKH